MKAYILYFLLLLGFSPAIQSQNMIKGILNIDVQSISGDADVFTDWQGGFEYLLSNVSVGASLGLLFDEGGAAYIMDGELKYYPKADYEGIGYGGFLGFAFDDYSVYFRIGLEVYML